MTLDRSARWGNGALVAAALCLALLPLAASAGTTGKVSGRVLDTQQRPVLAATVALVGQPYGAFTDAQGRYTILNVPPGTYVVRANRVGFRPLEVSDVIVSADNTTKQDFTLQDATITTETVKVVAERPTVDVNLTSSRVTLTSEDIGELPVQELQDVVNLQAGVVDGHFRGGRLGEVQFQVDGVSVNNAFDNKAGLRIDRSLLQEVQVISGTFDAEYGQAMSGVVNAVLKTGTPTFQWNAELMTGGYFFPEGKSQRLVDDGVRPMTIQNYQVTLSGPLPLPKTVYLLNARRYDHDEYLQATRVFEITPTPVFEDDRFVGFTPTLGDGEERPLGYTEEWSGAFKLTNSSLSNTKINYQALVNFVDGRRLEYAFRFNPDGQPKQHTVSVAHGFDWTQTLSGKAYFEVAARQNYRHYTDWVFEDAFDPRYDAAGKLRDIPGQEGFWVWGADWTRYEQRTNAFLVKGSFVSQLNREQQLKTGLELQLPVVEFGSPWALVEDASGLKRRANEPPDFPGVRSYYPVIAGAFVQDNLEKDDITLRAGVRVDYFDARASLPGDLANPANAIQGSPTAPPVSTTIKTAVSPRLGVAYPVTDRIGVHFAYGHFYQFPPIGQIFENSDYGVLANLQAGQELLRYGVLGNPDIEPERTVMYEVGFKQALGQRFGYEVSAFYKDIRDLLGIEFVSTYTGAQYARLANTDFGSVLGVTVALDHRELGPATLALDYTWQLAQGNSSDPRETANRAAAREDPRPRVVPFNWDQRHTFNMTLSLAEPGDWTASTVVRAGSGQPYTPILDTGYGAGLRTNSGRKPVSLVIDLRGEKRLGRRGLQLFGRVFNLLDTRYQNGFVFASTGSPYYSRFSGPDRIQLEDPTRFFGPRRIEVGFTLDSGLFSAGGTP